MDGTSLDNRLIEINRENNFTVDDSSQNSIRENWFTMKKSRIYVILLSISIFLIGGGILVYLLSSNDNTKTCQCVTPDGCSVNAGNSSAGASAPFINKQTTLPEQTTISAFTSTKNSASEKTTEGKQECQENWVSNGQSCYFFSNQSATWLEAMIRCKNLGAYLVEITTADENDFLKRHAEYLSKLYKRDCYDSSPSRYDGHQSTTYDGHTCQRWASQSPHEHTRNQANRFPDTSVTAASNYCRDPDGEGLPWCYTTDISTRWRFCDIYKCPGGNYWTGVVTLEGKWTWITSQTELGQLGYSNWAPGEPDSKYTCGSFVGAINFQWEATKCLFPAMYICEK